MIERGDHTVIDEPFSQRYYFSAERRSGRYPDKDTGATAEVVLQRLHDAARERPVFVKDMAYHACDLLDAGFLADFANTYLVREPAAALASLERMWPDFTDEEAGYDALGRTFDIAPGPVLEADDLAHDPPGLIRAWCEAVRIGFEPGALTWKPGMVPQWEHWQDWYEGVANSTGFVPPEPRTGPPADSSERVRAVLTGALPVYDRMVASKLTAPR